jgi:TonB family protein
MAQGGAIPARAIGSVRLLGALWSILPGLVIAASPEPGAAQDLRATVAGIVVDSLGSPVVGAQVTVDGTLLHASTDAAGHFRLTDVPVGSLYLVVRRIGFRAATVPVRLGPAGASQLMVTLSVVPELLAPVEVTEPREVYDARLYGFESRAAKRKNGHFITRDRIEHLSSKRLSDLLRQVPAVRLAMVRGQGMMAYIRGARCPALVYIDGSPASAGPFDLDLVDVWTIEGIEVYGGFGAPAEFSSARADRCGVIAIWSRPFRPQARPAEPPAQTSLITAQVELDMVFEADAVDSVAIPVPGSIRTTYPDSLFRAQISGSATVRFIVDTIGLVEMSTLEVSATHDLFAHAARAALSEARFTPAVLQGRRVRQVVAIPFRFTPPRLSGEPRLPPK